MLASAATVAAVRSFLHNTSAGQQVAKFPVTVVLTVLLAAFSFLALAVKTTTPEANANAVVGQLGVSPSDTFMRGKLWTVVTCNLVEENAVKLAVFGALAITGTYTLEQAMGSVSLAKLLVVPQAAASSASALVFFATYFFTLDDTIFFSHIFGLGGVLVSLAVGLVRHGRLVGGQRLFLVPSIALYALLGLQFPLYDALLAVFSLPFSVYWLSGSDDGFSWRVLFFSTAGNFSSSSSSTTTTTTSSTTSALALAAADPSKARFRDRGFKLLDKKLAELEAAPEVSLDELEKGSSSTSSTNNNSNNNNSAAAATMAVAAASAAQ